MPVAFVKVIFFIKRRMSIENCGFLWYNITYSRFKGDYDGYQKVRQLGGTTVGYRKKE